MRPAERRGIMKVALRVRKVGQHCCRCTHYGNSGRQRLSSWSVLYAAACIGYQQAGCAVCSVLCAVVHAASVRENQ